MILFNKDWAEQGAMPDYTTGNESWIKFAALLNSMGVKNHSFHLALHNQGLKGIDPHDPTLSNEIRGQMMIECRINPWYMLREVAKVPAGSGADAEPVRANRGIICMFWCFYARVTLMQIQPRQTGKSLGSDFLKLNLLFYRNRNTLINLFTKDEDLRKENIDRVKGMMMSLPPWMDLRNKSDSDNKEGITVNALGNKLVAHLPRSDPRNAERVGRGFTSSQHFYDELPFMSWVELMYPASIAAMNDAVDRAKRAGADYGVVITTTAGKKDDRDGKYAYKLACTACPWDERFYDTLDKEDLEQIVRTNTSDGTNMIYAVFNHRQLGYTDAWLKEKIANAKGTPEEAERDFLCRWTSGTGQSPFTAHQADKIRASQIHVEYMQITEENYILRWYCKKEEIPRVMSQSKFILGVDTSEAGGGDDIGFYLIDTKTLKVVCSAKINETNIITFAQFLADFLLRFENVLLIPERKSTGSSIVDYLLRILPSKGENPFKRIFNMVVHDADLDRGRFDDIKGKSVPGQDPMNRYRKLFGYATTGSGATSRNNLYKDTMFMVLDKIDGRFHDETVINQLLGLEWRNNRIDHAAGGHDDLVVAMLLAYWLLLFGKNLSYYGLYPEDIMSQMEDLSNLSPMEKMRSVEQQKYRNEMKVLAEQYANERDPIKVTRLEYQMRNLERKLVLESNEINTVDELIRKTKEEKQRKQSRRIREGVVSRLEVRPRVDESSTYSGYYR